MRTTAPPRKAVAIAATIVFVARTPAIHLRLRLILRLRTVLALAVFTFAVLARLLLIALIGVRLARLLARAVIAHIGLGLLRGNETGLLPKAGEILRVFIAVIRDDLVRAGLLRLILAELFLRRCDQAKIMLGVLIVVLGGDGVARGARVPRKLQIFLCDVRGGATDLDIGPVGFEHPRHRILATPVVVIVTPVAHPLVLT